MLPSQNDRLSGALASELQLGDREFNFIRTVVEKNTGIVLASSKKQLVQGRLSRRIRELGLSGFADYCELVKNGGPEELVGLVNSITTNVTAFFRENHHFEALASVMLPEAMARNERSRRLRIWSAACSSGEEPYSIAMTALEHIQNAGRWDFKILATDIDSDILNSAAKGEYPMERLNGISDERKRRWFVAGVGAQEGNVRVKPELQTIITFRTLNLIGEWPMQGPFDVIFCRNVMIYFDQPTRDRLLARYARMLANGGYLCLGHSESIPPQHAHFKLVGRTVYRKTGG